MLRLGLREISFAAVVCGFGAITNVASASIIITEVDPFGSNGTTGYGQDWFELTNTGSSAVNISGYGMIDSHTLSGTNLPAALTLAGGGTSIGAGQSAIFLESTTNAAGSATLISQFESAWFGSNVPAGLLVGVADDNGAYGLSQSSDAVNIYNGTTASASLVASVTFGSDAVASGPMTTFDNAAELNNVALTTKSVVGVNGAFTSASGLEIGSPGVIAPVPLPAALPLLLSGLGLFGVSRGRKALKA